LANTLCARCDLKRNCPYYAQFAGQGHRFATLPHLQTKYPERATAVVLDELTPQDLLDNVMLPEAELQRLMAERNTPPELRRLADLLYRALAAAHSSQAVRGHELLTLLASAANGSLAAMLEEAA
jgi:DNA-binding FadR family transcriptional regulator